MSGSITSPLVAARDDATSRPAVERTTGDSAEAAQIPASAPSELVDGMTSPRPVVSDDDGAEAPLTRVSAPDTTHRGETT